MSELGKLIGAATLKLTTVEKEIIAGKMGITRRTLDNVINGKSDLSLDQVAILSDELQIDLFKRYFEATGRSHFFAVNEPKEEYRPIDEYISMNLTVKIKKNLKTDLNNFLLELKYLCEKFECKLD